jgi:hypothetical protein
MCAVTPWMDTVSSFFVLFFYQHSMLGHACVAQKRSLMSTLACSLFPVRCLGVLFWCRYVGSVAHLKPSVAVQGGRLDYSEVPREGIASSVDYVAEMSTGRDKAADGGGGTPYLRLLSPHGPSGSRAVDNELTRRYLDALKSVCTYCPPSSAAHTHTHTHTHTIPP